MSNTTVFWLLAGVMALMVLVWLLAPLLRRPRRAHARAEYDLAIYRDQMRELEEEIAQGRISGEAADKARNEIARRILAADKALRQAEQRLQGANRGAAVAAVVAALAVPAAAVAFYMQVGDPARPDMPLERRLADAAKNNDLAALVKRAEQRLAKEPDNPRGWMALAPAYEQLGQLDKAIEAWRKAIELTDKPPAELYNAYAEAVVRAANGRIPEQAVRAFAKAQELSPGDPMSRYYLAMADLQAGKREKAYESLKKLLADLPPDVPARAAVVRQVRRLAQMLGKEQPRLADASGAAAASGAVPMSDAVRQQMQAMRNASPEERQAMIRNMVEGLAERLKDDPKNLGGWLRLIRARMVLGEKDKAQAALQQAQQAFADDEAALSRLRAMAGQMGVKAGAAAASAPMAPRVAAGASGSGPTAEQIRERMRQMRDASPEERQAMIRNMVDNLAAKLEDNPQNLGGWLRLIRARMVLGEKDKAQAALSRANEVFAGNEEARKRLAALAAQLGITP